MTVYKGSDDAEGEGEKEIVEDNILLSDYTTSDELHALFERLGFEKKDVEVADETTSATTATDVEKEIAEEVEKLAKATAEKERKLQEQRRIDEEEIKRKKIELNNRRLEMMRREQRTRKDRGGAGAYGDDRMAQEMARLNANAKMDQYQNDKDLLRLNKMMEESQINEKKLYKLMKEVEKGQRDPDDEQILLLRRQIEKTKAMMSRRSRMDADNEKLRMEYIKQMREQRIGARNDL